MKCHSQIFLTLSTVVGIASTAIAQPEEVEFVLPLSRGWNMISAPVIPENADIEAIFSDLVERDNLLICKDENGNFYSPLLNFNNIGDWDFHRGYKVKLANTDTLVIRGEPVDPETPIQLVRGWNLAAYFLDHVQDAAFAFADDFLNQLIIVKDGRGNFYTPDWGFPVLWLRPGQGYYMKVSEDVELVWYSE